MLMSLLTRWCVYLVMGMTATIGYVGTLYAQTTSALYNPGQVKIDAQLKPWLANVEHVEATNVSVSLLDYRLKIEPCEKPISFDFPFASHKTVRAKCDSPSWQYFLQVNVGQPNTVPPGNAVAALTPSPTIATTTTTPPHPQQQLQQQIQQQPKGPEISASKVIPPNTLNTGFHTVLTSQQFLKRGTILEPNMFIGTEVASQPGDLSALSNPKDVANMELLRDLPANTPLKSFDVKPMVMIKRGQQVIVSVGEGKGFLISIRAESLQDGQLGDQIRLKNTESGRSISAVVTGVNTAKAM